MRLWSLHPKYLDARGLTALWREGLLAQKVLQGRTKGYRAHPQLERFKMQKDPVAAVSIYLCEVAREARRRGYSFDAAKLAPIENGRRGKMTVTRGQLDYEFRWLCEKLKIRDVKRYRELVGVSPVIAHPCFKVVPGDVAAWERLQAPENLPESNILGADCCGDL